MQEMDYEVGYVFVTVPTLPCSLLELPVNGNWGEWDPWSVCDQTCGPGLQLRTRQCNNPAPTFDGNFCEPPTFESRECSNSPECPNSCQFKDLAEIVGLLVPLTCSKMSVVPLND